MKQAFAGLHEEFPDVRVDIESIVAEGDMVAVRLTFSGTHAPTGERATWPEMVFTRFSGGKAVESWEVTDTGRSWNALPGRRGRRTPSQRAASAMAGQPEVERDRERGVAARPEYAGLWRSRAETRFLVEPGPVVVAHAGLPFAQGVFRWARQDSNLGPRDYESPALTG